MSRTCPYQDCKCPNLLNASRACPACGRPVYWMGSYDYTELITDRTRDFTGRDWVFAKLVAWLATPSGQRVFFLGGGPGSGKSAVAARLVQLARGDVLVDKWPLLAQTGLTYYHFCQARYDALIEPVGFVKSLALALADRYPVFAQALTQSGERHPEIHIQQSVGQATDSVITAVKSALATGLSLDEAVTWARLHLLEPGVLPQEQQWQWGTFMVYMLTQEATLFPKPNQGRAGERQTVARHERKQTIINVYQTIGTVYGGQVVGVQESRS